MPVRCLIIFALCVSGSTVRAQTTENKQIASDNTDLIQNGDEIDIDVLGSVEYDWRGKPDDEGFLSSLPYSSETFFALCRTTDEIAADLVKSYSKILKNPMIEVRIVDRSARSSSMLLGAIRTQSRLQIQREIRLNELIVMFGGITDNASGEVEIIRPANLSCIAHNQIQRETQTLKIKLSDLIAGKSEANPIIKSGDFITIGQAPPVYLIGGVAAPQRIFFRNQLTLTRALSSVGGFSKDANSSEITIYRRSKDKGRTDILKADFSLIEKKIAKDIELQPFDIIEVNRSGRIRSLRPPRFDDSENSASSVDKLPLRVID